MSIEGNVAAKTLRGKITTSTGDMSASVYDTEGKARDIFSYVDEEIEKALNSIDDLTEVQDQVDEAVTTAKTAQSTAIAAQTAATDAQTKANEALEVAEAVEDAVANITVDNMELIASVTLGEATSGVTIDTDTNGNAFELRKAMAYVDFSKVEGGYFDARDVICAARTPADELVGWTVFEMFSDNFRHIIEAVYKFEKYPDGYFTEGCIGTKVGENDNGDIFGVETRRARLLQADGYVVRFLFSLIGEFPAGTVIKVYGVRA